MAGSFQHVRRHRTTFTAEQLEVLKSVFQKTKIPSFETVAELASTLNLDEAVVKTWFKNQRVKWKKQQQEMEPGVLPGPSTQNTEENEVVSPSPVTAENRVPWNSATTHHQDDDVPRSSGLGQPVLDSERDCLPPDLKDICLRVSDSPWANTTLDMDQFIKMYHISGEEDPRSLDRYLLPLA
ncbi:paired-like homeodomain transcription factor LEUTX [Marmota flaviventris]|uniref:paired-like homeodomain transcription factor LEUTX n=1 Tax=Marmota flaviventris TaxID=93162 RepID=UPI000FFF9E1A|nr:paired-like homeodomain transcription factor LEUTX [Marmota flaviventris]